MKYKIMSISPGFSTPLSRSQEFTSPIFVKNALKYARKTGKDGETFYAIDVETGERIPECPICEKLTQHGRPLCWYHWLMASIVSGDLVRAWHTTQDAPEAHQEATQALIADIQHKHDTGQIHH